MAEQPYTYRHPHYAITTDAVVFTIRDGHLHVLLIQRGVLPFKGKWALPGGFLKPEESLEQCVRRELREETGAGGFYLEQLETFGDVHRDRRERVVTVAYLALVRTDRVSIESGTDARHAQWISVASLPPLAFDHGEIVAKALKRLRSKLGYSTMALQLAPDRFTMGELHSIYEAVLGPPVDRRNFHKLFEKFVDKEDIVKGGVRRGVHRPAAQYRLRDPAVVRNW